MDKKAVALTFGKAAKSYDQAAHLQRSVADNLLDIVQEHVASAKTVVDLGSGTGYCLPRLAKAYAPNQLLALDLSWEMLEVATQREPSVRALVGDLESPPFENQTIDLAVSSLAVQWLDRPEPFITRMAEALNVGGVLALTSLGPNTLNELKSAWAQVDSVPHVNSFHPVSVWLEAISNSSLELVDAREQSMEVPYDHPLTLLQELKALGAHFVDRKSPSKTSSVRQMLKFYSQFRRPDGRFPATWDIYYLVVRKR